MFSCSHNQEQNKKPVNQLVTLDEKGLKNYLKAITAIQNESTALFMELNKEGELNKNTKESLEKIIKKGGFETLDQFIALNNKVLVVFKSVHIQKDKEDQRMTKMKQFNIDATEYKLVEKYIQELAEAFQEIDFSTSTKE
jgi:ribosomal protein S17E